MQSTQGTVWDRLTADLASLAGSDHCVTPADMFALPVEHSHPASPPCWPTAKRRVYDEERRVFVALCRCIGTLAKATFVRGSRTAGMAALSKRFDLSQDRLRAVLEHMDAVS
jgi:hypothetical protein